MIKWLVQRMQIPDTTPAGSAVRAGGIEEVTNRFGTIHRHRRTKKVHMKQALPGHQRQTRFLMVFAGAVLIVFIITALMLLNRGRLENDVNQGRPGAGPVNFYP